MQTRYIIWKDSSSERCQTVEELLGEFPDVEIVKLSGPDSVVVLMDHETEARVRNEHPDLSVEMDVRHKLVSSF